MATLYVADGYIDEGYIQTGVTVIWGNNEIFVPKIAMIQVQSSPTEIWQLDIPTFKETLADLLDDEHGMSYPDIFSHNSAVSVGGAILAEVVQILAPYTITFEDGQYAVNLTGANSNIGDRVNVNQVSIRSANSAGLQDLESLQAASFGDGAVAISQTLGISGITFPIGTKGVPVNNWIDARTIADNKNMDKIVVLGNSSVVAGDDISNLIIKGTNPMLSSLTVDDAANTYGAYIQELYFSGALDGGSILRDCVLGVVRYFNGYIEKCALTTGTIFINGNAVIMNCVTGYNVEVPPEIDLTNAMDVAIRNFDGHLRLINCTDANVHVDITLAGDLYIDSSITEGTFHIHGDCNVHHVQTGNEVVTDMSNGSPTDIAKAVWNYNI